MAAARCNDEDEDDEPPLSKRILKEGGGGSEGKTHTHCVLPYRENPPSREKVQGSHYLSRLYQLAPGSGIGPHAPAHLSIGSGWLGEGGGVSGWVGGKEKEGRAKEGVHRGLHPRRLCAGAVAATAGRGRQHGGVSGGVGASQQQWRP